MCARIWWVRPVSSRTRSSVVRGRPPSTSKWVRASRAARAPHGHELAVGTVAPDRGVDRAAAGVRPALDEREVLALDLPRCGSAPAARGEPGRTSPPPSAPRCRGRAGGRCPGATDRARRPRGSPAPARACPWGAPAPGARPRRRACRRPAGARPRAPPRTERPRRPPGRPGPAARAARSARARRPRAGAASAARRRPRSRRPPRSGAARPRATRRTRATRGRRRAARRRRPAGATTSIGAVIGRPPPRRAARAPRRRSRCPRG